MKPKLYIETSIISYLAARPSKDLMLAGQQASTRLWWKEKRRMYHMFASKLVWQEAGGGDTEAAKRRLKFLRPFPWVQPTAPVVRLARALVENKAVPQNAADDATHIALAAVYAMDFLLTWNFTHINNPSTEDQIREICRQHGSHPPAICTPDQLLSS